MTLRLHRSPARVRALLAALAVAAAVAACEDPIGLKANDETETFDFAIWALSGTPDEYPTAFRVHSMFVTTPDPGGNFDLAFDLDASDRLVVLPVHRVVTPLAGARSVTFITPATPFGLITEAPASGYTADTALVLDVGDAFIVKVASTSCQFELRQEVYAKFVVDSIIPAERRVRISSTTNPNCGFRSFASGIPKF